MKIMLWRRLALPALVVCSLIAAGCGGAKDSGSSSGASTDSGKPAETAKPAEQTAQLDPAEFPDYGKFAPPDFKPPTKQVHIAALIADTTIPIQKSIVQGWKDGAEKYNVKLDIYDAGGYANVARQVSQFETAIGTGPQAIIILPCSPVALNAQIDQAVAKKIPVFGQLVPPTSDKVTFSLADPLVDDGKLLLSEVAKRIGDSGDIFIINGGAGGAPDSLVTQGMKEELKNHPNIKVKFERHLQQFSSAEAQQAAESAVVKNPDVKAVVTNSTTVAEGAAKAFEQAGKKVIVSGFGPDTAAHVQNIRDGKIALGVATPFYRSGTLMIEWALAVNEGAKPEQPLVPIPPMLVTPDNVDAAVSSGRLFEGLHPSVLGCGPGQSKEC
jgi:ABC-type sugar transport system substrate-binding protein